MTLDLKPDAVQFVRDHNCAMSTSVELVEEAMKLGAYIGAAHVLRVETSRLRRLRAGLDVNEGGEKSGTLVVNSGH